MWSPTHVLVTVHRARGLLTKGRNGTNDAFVTIALGKEKYQTSVKEKADKDVEWHEECELPIPKQGNTAEIVLTALHRNFMGVDEFLGVINIPLADFDVYERPRCKWYELKSKPGKEKQKHRGELEVKVTFIVKAGSLTDLSKKEKHKSLGQLSHMAQSVGGSLLSIGSLEKRKSLKKIAKSIGKKVGKGSNNKLKEEESFDGSLGPSHRRIGQIAGEADPGVISEDEDEFTFDDLSHKSSLSSLSTSQQTAATPPAGSLENLAGGEFLRRTNMTGTVSVPPKPPRSVSQDKTVDEWEQKLYGKQGKDSVINNSDTLKRRSWDTSKSFTMSQCEDKEFDNNPHSSTPAIVRANTIDSSVTVLRKVNEETPKTITEISAQDEKEKEKTKEKDKDISKLARRFKHFRKGDVKNEETIPEVKTPTAEERIIIGGENDDKKVRSCGNKTPDSVIQKYENNTKEELISIIYNLQLTVEDQNKKVKDLEDYLDNLLLRVMETTPRILQNPYVSVKTEIDSR